MTSKYHKWVSNVMDCESEKIIPDFIDEDCSKHDWIKVDEGERKEKEKNICTTASLWQLCYGSYDLCCGSHDICCGSQHKDRDSENSSAEIIPPLFFVLIFRFVTIQIVIFHY
jgi:hypothetical protein